MADEIRLDIRAAELALRLLERTVQDWQQDQAGIKEAMHGVTEEQQSDAVIGLRYMLEDFADKRMDRITETMERTGQGIRTYLETFQREDEKEARDIRGGR